MPCCETFIWRGRIGARLHKGKATVSPYPQFDIDFLACLLLNGKVRFRCCDDTLKVLDHYAWESKPGPDELVLPDSFTAEKKKDILGTDFFAKQYFTIEDKTCEVTPDGTCVTITLGATFRFLKGVKGSVQITPGGNNTEVNGSDMEDDCRVRVTASFEVCCCTEEATNEQLTCSWSSECLDFDHEQLDKNEKMPKLTNISLDWELDADVGSCGKVKNAKDIKTGEVKKK